MRVFTHWVAPTLLAIASFSLFAKPLNIDVYHGDGNSFYVTASIISGDKDAILIDSGFTQADALRIAAKILDSGKNLKTIFISQADPDYYFGAATLRQLFPAVNIITTPAVKHTIATKLAGKLAFWGPKLGANGPQSGLVPDVINTDILMLEGERIEIKATQGQFNHRPYLWLPSNQAIVGNVAVYADVHLWMADAQSDAAQQAWQAQLEAMLALNPKLVVPGHMKPNSAMDATAIHYSLNYLKAFSAAKAASVQSTELIDKMQQLYPSAVLPMALEIGAKVHTGEMQW
ncbi:MBL fold metallo-hydrolase [Pseudoalteromonas fenneropenaei]|uniref:MBL fold metallo-hydrolase n=1 Tax=Pseudoalteromonas fenneropenaei TaxID=1737459 RepID=A0ABV7CGN2_9GAMM